MKQFFSLVLAGIIGGAIVLGLQGKITKNTSISDRESVPQAVLASSANVPLENSDFVKAAAKATPAVVHIRVEESSALAKERYQEDLQRYRQRDFFGRSFDLEDFFGLGPNFHIKKGSGSGVVISGDGYIVTNNHVVGFGDKISVIFPDGTKKSAEKIGTDPNSDLAVIKVEGQNLAKVDFGNSDNLAIGEWVLAVGNPFDYLTSTVTAGIVSAKNRDIDILQGNKAIEEFIQTDAVINPGNSGGALVNTKGELMGINTAIATPTGVYAGYSFAIPSNMVKDIAFYIMENGDIERPFLGVQAYDVQDMRKDGMEVEYDYGVYVDEVINGSSAQFAGVLPGDIIVNVNGQEIKSFDGLVDSLKFVKVNDIVQLKVIRNGRERAIDVKMRRGV